MAHPSAFISRIETFLLARGISLSGEKVLVGLSGGADSVCLLLALRELGAEVFAAHCNFHLRGEESDRDAAFCEQLCQQLGIRLYQTDFDTEAYARANGLSIEMAARKLRYDYFEQLLEKEDLSCVAVGHHVEDNIETFFLNLQRGTGIKGLCGMSVLRGYLLRPLLCVSREEIENYLASRHQPFVHDSSNTDRKYRRNALRHDLLPLFRTMDPAFDRTMQQNMSHIAEADTALAEFSAMMIQKYVRAQGDRYTIDLAGLTQLASAHFLLHEWLSPFGFNESQLSDIMRHFGCASGQLFCTPTHVATLTIDTLEIAPKRAPLPPVELADGITALPDWRVIEMETSHEVRVSKERFEATIDAQKIKGHLYVRSTEDGDRFQPFGMNSTKLVSDYLTDRHRSRIDKLHALVVCDDEGIVWLVGERVSQRVSIDSNTCIMKVLRYSEQ